MAVLNFPQNPVEGQVYESGGRSWTFNGRGWIGNTAASIEFATNAETDAGVIANKAVQPAGGAYAYDRLRHAGQHEAGKGTAIVELVPDTGVVTIDGNLSNVFEITLTENVTFAAPVNLKNGQVYNVIITQDVTGGWTATFDEEWTFTNRTDPVLSSDPGAVDMLSCQWQPNAARVRATLLPDFGAGYTPPDPPSFEDFDFVNVGGGNELFRDVIGTNVNFRTIVGEGDVAVTTDGDTVVVSYSAPATTTVENFDDLLDVDVSDAALGDSIAFDGTNWVASRGRRWTLGATWTNGPNALATPVNAVHAFVSEPARIVGWYLLTDSESGSCVVDVRNTTLASYPADAGDTICSGVEPAVTDAYTANDTDLTGWTVECDEGDILQFVLESVSGFTTVQIVLVMERDNS